MGWEKRGNKYYYYIKIRKGVRVVSTYCGKGPHIDSLADLIEESKEINARNKQININSLRAAKEIFNTMDTAIRQYEELVQPEIESFFLVHGYHKHRGEWRKKREPKE